MSIPPTPEPERTDRPVSPEAPPTYAPPYAAPAPYQVVNDDQRRIMAAKGGRAIAFGVVWILFGLAVSLYTFSRASAIGGGSYLLFWGPVVYGAFRVFSGWRQIDRSRR